MKAEAVPGQIRTLYSALRPAVAESGGDVDKAIDVNAKIHADLPATSSAVIRNAIKAGKLKVDADVYNLATGNFKLS